MFRAAVSTLHELIPDVDSKESGPRQWSECSPTPGDHVCTTFPLEGLTVMSSHRVQLTGAGRPQCLEQRNLSGRPRLDRINSLCKLVLSKMPLIASTSMRHSERRKEAPPQLMSVYFCQPGKTSNLLAPRPRLVLRRSRCRQHVRKMSDTSGFQRRDLELRFRDSQEMSGPHVCTPLQGDEVVRGWVCPVF